MLTAIKKIDVLESFSTVINPLGTLVTFYTRINYFGSNLP